MRKLLPLVLAVLATSCSAKYDKTVDHVDRDRFMGKWFVQAGRFTFLEKDVTNAVEAYTWSEKEERIDIDFHFNQKTFDGPLKSYPQKAWIVSENNARWKVQPFWPLKFSYLVIGLDPDYQWTAIGVPDEKYLWIMSRDPHFSRENIQRVLDQVESTGYDVTDVEFVPHE